MATTYQSRLSQWYTFQFPAFMGRCLKYDLWEGLIALDVDLTDQRQMLSLGWSHSACSNAKGN
ncbi:hypothetical protein CBM2609_P260005 [Cupriavidus taiwanensis]|uniref:Uncharacterized protein n=3 Tax=Cupriavidus TaxID=106589 RepID=A0A375HW68_9BURK|nr:hypothetical protein CBM2585_P260004 [Cupriavidus taiwanensis]SPD62451.1 protein of unknown function [Cupriavidus neocaledonicus]SOZ33958.1 hypothetical protein CBM2609_P260005 [Cupriavidus taiwanensis]SPA21610.1 hypothetical protein CBM2631_P280004 [Cupriavidus taiwanensis]SPA53517.1 hypothetical protein CBM2629_P300004 [Cupriavidus taiwanensis]